MPGPSNAKKKRKAQAKKRKDKERRAAQTKAQEEVHEEVPEETYEDVHDELEIRVEAEYEVEEVEEPRERYRPLKSQPLRYMSRPARQGHGREQYGRHARHGPRDSSRGAGPTAHSTFSSSTDSPSPARLQYHSLSPSPGKPQYHAGILSDTAYKPEEAEAYHDAVVPAPPCVTDQGNGPHVNDVRAFLASRLCSAPSLDEPLCAEFAREEVCEMLSAVLPEDMALILWHNKSRASARICPACRRLYRLGELVREPLLDDGSPVRLPEDDDSARADAQAQRRRREQEISGICSALCFMLVAHRYPAALRGCWGRVADELADATWDELDAPLPRSAADEGLGFSMVLKMTRCHDLGLGQLFGVDEDAASAGGAESEGEDPEEY